MKKFQKENNLYKDKNNIILIIWKKKLIKNLKMNIFTFL